MMGENLEGGDLRRAGGGDQREQPKTDVVQQERSSVREDVRKHLAYRDGGTNASTTSLGFANGLKERRQQDSRQANHEEQKLPRMNRPHQSQTQAAFRSHVFSHSPAEQQPHA